MSKTHWITSVWQHVKQNAFIIATAGAALVHSTWTLGTLFSGMQPAIVASPSDAEFWNQVLKSLAWHLPAFAIAFSLDVGQVVTSAEIRAGKRNKSKYATFFIFSAATFYLQMMYMVAHVPQLTLGGGVAVWMQNFVQSLVDHAILIVPFLLPASTLLYTFSQGGDTHASPDMQIEATIPVQHQHVHMHTAAPVEVTTPVLSAVQVQPALPPAPIMKALPKVARVSARGNTNGEAASMVQQTDDGLYFVQCAKCQYARGGYASFDSAVKAAAGHIGRWCKGADAALQVQAMQGANNNNASFTYGMSETVERERKEMVQP